jgi:hypothetical protein
LIVVLIEKYQEGRYSNKEFVAASGGRKEETKCLIVVVSAVNSMGKEFTTGRVKEAGIPRRVKREEKRDFGGGFGEKKPSHH